MSSSRASSAHGEPVRIGAGSGFAGDRIDPARALAEHARLDYLVFETLGERTIAQANARRLAGTGVGFDALLPRRLEATLGPMVAQGSTIVTNGGGSDPDGAAEMATDLATRVVASVGRPVRIASITGDDVLGVVEDLDPVVWEDGRPLSEQEGELVSANAYIGAAPIVEALESGADVVIGGRLADPSLYLGPLAHAHGWDLEADPDILGRGTVIGHLLECAGQLTGGYYADPVTKPVPRLADLGFPFADVTMDGAAVLGKLDGTGGMLTTRTATEQLLYEVGDPARYITPDVVADFTEVRLNDAGQDRVAVTGGRGHSRTDTLKVTLGFRGNWLGEGQITYAGPRSSARAKMAADIVRERLVTVHGLDAGAVMVEYVGTGAAFRGLGEIADPPEVRLRVSAVVPDQQQAEAVGWEVEALYTNGPAAGGGARRSAHSMLAIRSCLVPRHLVPTSVRMQEVVP